MAGKALSVVTAHTKGPIISKNKIIIMAHVALLILLLSLNYAVHWLEETLPTFPVCRQSGRSSCVWKHFVNALTRYSR